METDSSKNENPKKKILITGVSKGLGRALAIEFAKLGHTIIGCSRDQTKLDSLQTDLNFFNSASPNHHLLLNVDVSSNSSIEEMARTVLDNNGVPDIIVNNAAVINKNGKFWEVGREEFDKLIDINVKGTANVLRHFIPLMLPKNQGIIVNMSSSAGRSAIPLTSNSSIEEMARTVFDHNGVPDIIVNNAAVINRNGEFWEVGREEFDKVIDINVKGTANVLRHFIPLMLPKNKGIIVNMSSMAGRNASALVAPYCSSKWAIEGLTKSVAKELPEGMAIVSLDPGTIYTEMLVSCLGNSASQYQSPEEWALEAASMILNLTSAENGASLTIKDPGYYPVWKPLTSS